MIINSNSHKKLEYFLANKDKFHIISDFDATLNQYYNNEGEITQGVVALLHHYGTLSENYTKAAKQQFKKYEPREFDTSLPMKERLQAMTARRTENIELLRDEKLHYHTLQETIELDKIIMRQGADNLIQFAKQSHIPFIIFSASSIGFDAIILTLRHWGIEFDPHFIVANRVKRDHNKYLQGLENDLIHSLNKKESVIRNDTRYSKIQQAITDKPHAIVIGDQIHDAHMVDSKPGKTILRIGLLNTKDQDKKQEFLKNFDIILTNDASFHELNYLLQGNIVNPHFRKQALYNFA